MGAAAGTAIARALKVDRGRVARVRSKANVIETPAVDAIKAVMRIEITQEVAKLKLGQNQMHRMGKLHRSSSRGRATREGYRSIALVGQTAADVRDRPLQLRSPLRPMCTSSEHRRASW